MTTRTPPTPSKEAMALAAAMTTSRLNNVAVAKHMRVSDGLVSQWVTGRRPVPPEKAVRLAAYVGTDPERISAKYAATLTAQTHGNVVALPKDDGDDLDPRRLDLIVRRLENDVDSLRYALAAIVTVMTVHRPAEAADVAKMLRKHVPAKFVQQGYVQELLQALEKAG